MKTLATFALFASLPFSLLAGVNTIYLKDGRNISGRLMDGNSGTIAFQDDNGRDYRFRTAEVDRITFGNGGGQNYGNNQNYNNNRNPNNNNGYNQNARGNSNSSRVMPAGAELAVRTTSTISSKNSNDNQVFSASVERDVMDTNGGVLIPRGSPVELVIRDASGGSSRNSTDLLLDVQAISVNGQRYLVGTEEVSQQGSGRQGIGANKRTGVFVGGGTALGTLLGAVAGGGKGALIGALAGAAAGVGAQVITKGSAVQVPSETVLSFRLDRPVYLNSGY